MLVIIILILTRTRYYTVTMNELFDHEKLTVYQEQAVHEVDNRLRTD